MIAAGIRHAPARDEVVLAVAGYSGAFTILDQDYEDEFWAYWRSDGHQFIPEEEAVDLMAKPWWLMEDPSNE